MENLYWSCLALSPMPSNTYRDIYKDHPLFENFIKTGKFDAELLSLLENSNPEIHNILDNLLEN